MKKKKRKQINNLWCIHSMKYLAIMKMNVKQVIKHSTLKHKFGEKVPKARYSLISLKKNVDK